MRNNAQGWGAAAATWILTIALAVMAYVIHERTYHDPRDPLGQPSPPTASEGH